MRNLRSYYSAALKEFLKHSSDEILGAICSNVDHSETRIQQSNAWHEGILILKNQLSNYSDARIIFEYTIPRMGKRVDAIVLYKNLIFILEFKIGDSIYKSSTYDQVYDYALDLRNFQKESHDKLLVPMIISTEAPETNNDIIIKNRIIEPLKCNKNNIGATIEFIANEFNEPAFDYIAWENSEYLPTPTIIEAAQALYRGHNVKDITRNDAGAENLTVTTEKINDIIKYSKDNNKKSICFLTGVPGAGKTLVGLNLAIEHSKTKEGEHAVFLSGNFPLVTVLQEALARDKVLQSKLCGIKLSKNEALRSTSAFIQIIHKYRDSFVGNAATPPERIAIFDEAQRAWTQSQISNFMKTKKGISDFPYSEPEFLINTMDRHMDWAVIICLIGGGQEINTGEAGLPEWFESLKRSYKDWEVFVSPKLNDSEYKRDQTWENMIDGLNIHNCKELHLATSIRSFRTPDLSEFVKEILDNDKEKARSLFKKIKNKYPILLTRNLTEAKEWVKSHSPGTTRYGLLASSGGLRLKPDGIFVKNDISVANWFLNGKDDVRSSYYLEDVVTEFDIQGLELDYSIIAWDADFRYDGNEWTYNKFVGNNWQCINSENNKLYLKNAYRVLLTRARQGMAVFIPIGNDNDSSKKCEFYDKTYEYLNDILSND